MHYIGMMALESPGRITWAPNLVVASVALGIAFGAAALYFAARRDVWLNALIATILFAAAIFSIHFTAMGAMLVMAEPTRVNNSTSASPAFLSLVIAATRHTPRMIAATPANEFESQISHLFASSTRNHQSVQATMRISDSSDSRIHCSHESRFYKSGY